MLAEIVGWAYVLAWSVSFYPQVFLNYHRKKTSGLSTEFLWYNVIGFTLYGIYNEINYTVQARGDDAVQLNDLVFCGHAWLISVVTIAQIPWYGGDLFKIISPHDYLMLLLLLCIGIAVVLNLAEVIPTSGGLSLAMVFGTLKMIISVTKYIPQAVLNCNRKSTEGFSIGNIILDFTGGALSLLQVAIVYGQGTNIKNNPIKIALGLISMSFDLLFMFQHYGLYRNSEERELERLRTDAELHPLESEDEPG